MPEETKKCTCPKTGSYLDALHELHCPMITSTYTTTTRERYEKDFWQMLEDLKLADAVINRDGIIYEWSAKWVEGECQRREEEAVKTERQFFLNVLDGIDIADEQIGIIGGTKAIRFALQSRLPTNP